MDETDGLMPLHVQKDWKFLLVSVLPILLAREFELKEVNTMMSKKEKN